MIYTFISIRLILVEYKKTKRDTMKNKTLLLVEDEVILAMDKIQCLKKMDYSVVYAASGEIAIDIVNHNNSHIDLILMDIDLGKAMDGTEAAQEILSTRDIPVVFLSSHTEKEIVEKTEKITSYGYVIKNSGMVVLDASIKMAFKLFEAYLEINRKNMAIKAGNENLRVTIEKLEETNNSLLQTEKELIVNMERYERAQQIGLIGSWEYDIASKTIWGSDEAKIIYNFPLGVDKFPLEKIEMMDYDREGMYKSLMDLIYNERPYDIEFEIMPEGLDSWKWLHSVAELQKDSKGKPLKVVGVVQDISRRKADEAALEKLNQAVSISSDIILMLDKEGTITFINSQFSKTYGYSKDEILGQVTPCILNYEHIGEEAERQFWRDLQKTYQLKREFKNKSKSGRFIYVEVSIDALFSNHGELTGFLEIQRDITDRKNTEIRLQESEESLSITLHSIGDGVLATDISGNITRINRIAEELTGWTTAEAIGKPLIEVFKIINMKTREIVENPVEKVLNTGNIVGLANHTVLISREGREYQIADSAAPIRDFDGMVQGVILVFSDVTEKYNREKERARIQLLFEAMFNTIPDGIVITDTERSIQLANEGMNCTFGYAPSEIIGKKTSILYAENKHYEDTGISVFNKEAKNSKKQYLSYYKDKLGHSFLGETLGSKLYDTEGLWIGNLSIVRNITEREKINIKGSSSSH